mmetsp:Transcript_46763/g.111215  ORF Transcript_46763/g.111215 Transcript_46763/m.111215 type:complete len:281 (+) Transcript_46763:98-940(+)|eukprot:CAMPEP_0178439796 /NCGR_PEP_ID=MMETSP0689_2-20121128/36373_1 /TAXON_ID=160604 /ORGANISM="Amphidinium massartii, Strain CS-259" /LENGTH=280 /DNA_ID=CAMNT_0020062401 /DNA_START=23 /DNA_END=865 /DNA_ORIENTATION=+
MSFDPSWSSGELAHALCDKLVAKGQLKEKPAFIREDREAKIKSIFEDVALDGKKMAAFDNPGPLEMLVRKGTSGETWVQHVIDGLVGMLPAEAASAAKKMGMDENAKEELAAAKEKSAQRRERLEDEGRTGGAGGGGGRGEGGGGGGKGEGKSRGNRGGGGEDGEGILREREDGGRRWDRDGETFNFNGQQQRRPRGENTRSNLENMECYNCGGLGHSSRDCPEPRKEKGKGKGKRREDQLQCINCKQYGHRSRDCPEPPDEELVRQRLAERAAREAAKA